MTKKIYIDSKGNQYTKAPGSVVIGNKRFIPARDKDLVLAGWTIKEVSDEHITYESIEH